MGKYNIRRLNAQGEVLERINSFDLPPNATVLDLKAAYAGQRRIYKDPTKLKLTYNTDEAPSDEGMFSLTLYVF